MKRALIPAVVALAVFAFAPSSTAYNSAKLVGHGPPKHAPIVESTTTTTVTTTAPTTTRRAIWPPADDPPVTWPVPTTTRIVGTADMPAAPTHLRYGMRVDHLIELRWEWTAKPYPANVAWSVCFFADGNSLCGANPHYSVEGSDFFVVLLPTYFANGSLPQCLILSVQVRFDDGQNSGIASAPSVCQGAR